MASLAAGTRIGPHEVLALIGKGGMGEVYRARDTLLNRDVALKVLPAAFAGDADRMARFEREAQVLASLNHPNIAQIYGVAESDGVRALVMEFVPGETLPSPLPLETALEYAKQIAGALEYAHERAVMHRDLKPANVKVTPEGHIKLLDFGLAKAIDHQPAADSNPSASPTLTLGHTQAGVIMGTAAYMSPEQAAGQPADRRADIWSFGALLYEMLTGARAFAGDSVPDTLAAVLKLDPDWTALPATIPSSLRKLIERCLTKNRRQRLQAIGEARIALEQCIAEPPGAIELRPAAPAPVRPAKPWLWIAATAVFALAALALAAIHFREAPPAAEPVRFSISPPEGGVFGNSVPSISPDGRKVAFYGFGAGGRGFIWIRELGSLELRSLPGTEGANRPFWSPDSRFLAFSAAGKLKKIDVASGSPVLLCDLPKSIGTLTVAGGWGSNGTIVFGRPRARERIWRVAEAGGMPSPVTPKQDPESSDGSPVFLPDGHHFLYAHTGGEQSEQSGIYVGSLDSPPEQQAARRLLPVIPSLVSGVQFVPGDPQGHLLYLRDSTLMAQAFDAGRLAVRGDPFPIAQQVSAFSASQNGVLAYSAGSPFVTANGRLAWFDRSGKSLGDLKEAGTVNTLDLSPDGTRVAVDRLGQGDNRYIWIVDVARGGVSTRLTSQHSSMNQIWSPDGARIAFTSQGDRNGLYLKSSNGVGAEEELLKEIATPSDWSRDGQFILFNMVGPNTGDDLWVLPVKGDRKPQVFLQTEFNERQGQFSPDGKWVAYSSDETGEYEIYILPFPASATSAGKIRVSADGGTMPRWRADGRELFYLSPSGKLMAVEVTPGAALRLGAPKALFDTSVVSTTIQGYRYAVDRSGQRFLMNSREREAAAQAFTVVLNWQATIKK